jgi:glycosyltransferase involved in cell wall biosynthesis
VPFGDIESMAEKIRNLYNDRQLLQNMGSKGSQLAKEKFDNKIHIHKMVEFYKSVITRVN